MKKRVKLTFPQRLIKKPVIFTMAKDYDVMPNIRRARVTETVGEMVLELEGIEENLEKGIKYLRVPKMLLPAPNSCRTGFHSCEKRKPQPNFWSAGQEDRKRSSPMASI